jgi:5-hydroxyisourate hydrolase-like protein (transthyretin family)
MFAKKSQPVEDRKVGHYKAAEKRRHAQADQDTNRNGRIGGRFS